MSPKRHTCVRTLAYDFTSGHRIPPHSHAEHQLVYASTGVMTVHAEGSWVIPAHRAVWVPARVVHSIEISGAVSMRTLYIEPRVSRSLPASCRALSVTPLLRELILHIVARGGLSRRAPRDARLLGVLLDELEAVPVEALHLPEPRDARARRVCDRLRSDPSDARPLGDLARGTGAGRRTIERLFQAETGLTFGRWRQQLRLVHSLKLLAAGAKVTSVALDVGYESPSAFVSAFRRALGTTPGRYFREAGP